MDLGASHWRTFTETKIKRVCCFSTMAIHQNVCVPPFVRLTDEPKENETHLFCCELLHRELLDHAAAKKHYHIGLQIP